MSCFKKSKKSENQKNDIGVTTKKSKKEFNKAMKKIFSDPRNVYKYNKIDRKNCMKKYQNEYLEKHKEYLEKNNDDHDAINENIVCNNKLIKDINHKVDIIFGFLGIVIIISLCYGMYYLI